MAGLLSLPDELLTEIYILAGLDTRSVVRLSATNRRLRAIWERDSDYIISRSLELKAPGHQDAIALTIMEARCSMPVSGFHHLDTEREEPLLRLHVPRLIHNLELASATCSGLLEWQTSTYKHQPLTHPLPPLYYLMRQFVIAYHYPELRRPLCATLKGLSDGSLKTYGRLATYLCRRVPVEAIRAHKIRDLEATREPEDDIEPVSVPPCKKSWEFAFEVRWRLEFDRDDGIDGGPDADYPFFGGRIDD